MTYVHPILLITEDLKTMDDPLTGLAPHVYTGLTCYVVGVVKCALHYM